MQNAARNEVLLVGRVAATATPLDLPSGDRLTSFRLVVDRGPSRRPVPEGRRRATVDTFDCVAWTAGLQRTAQSWQPGDTVEVQGAARRRFFRAGASVQSRFEIEVARAKRISKAA
ncbi:MAG: Single-stranded DNA-binding protein [Frankiales bacterium]|nr:Single-stranded DNA-binding protein [Frankiales bacterium]